MTIGVILSGCGVYDGSEIQETVLTLLALDKLGIDVKCFAPNIDQLQVVNHLNGELLEQKRNVLVESARITRGKIEDLKNYDSSTIDGLILPGGFGVAKNFTNWAIEGSNCTIDSQIEKVIQDHVSKGKPLAALCMAPTTVAKALVNHEPKLRLSLGHEDEKSAYGIKSIHLAVNSLGAITENTSIDDLLVDDINNIISCPCYMMEGSLTDISNGINKTVAKLVEMVTLYKEAK